MVIGEVSDGAAGHGWLRQAQRNVEREAAWQHGRSRFLARCSCFVLKGPATRCALLPRCGAEHLLLPPRQPACTDGGAVQPVRRGARRPWLRRAQRGCHLDQASVVEAGGRRRRPWRGVSLQHGRNAGPALDLHVGMRRLMRPGCAPLLQVFSVQNSGPLPSVALKFPKIKIINWFDIRKPEAEAQARAARGKGGLGGAAHATLLESLPTPGPAPLRPWQPSVTVTQPCLPCAGQHGGLDRDGQPHRAQRLSALREPGQRLLALAALLPADPARQGVRRLPGALEATAPWLPAGSAAWTQQGVE